MVGVGGGGGEGKRGKAEKMGKMKEQSARLQRGAERVLQVAVENVSLRVKIMHLGFEDALTLVSKTCS